MLGLGCDSEQRSNGRWWWMWFPAIFYIWQIFGFFKLWADRSCWGRKCWVVMKRDAWDEGLADWFYWNPVAIKWPFPGHVGFGLNASPRQIPLTKWRVRALWACHSDSTGSIGCHVELQLVVNFRQSCEDLGSQRLTHDLSAPLGLQNPSTVAVLPSSVVFLACLTSSVWLGVCWCLSQFFILWSFQACC